MATKMGTEIKTATMTTKRMAMKMMATTMDGEDSGDEGSNDGDKGQRRLDREDYGKEKMATMAKAMMDVGNKD